MYWSPPPLAATRSRSSASHWSCVCGLVIRQRRRAARQPVEQSQAGGGTAARHRPASLRRCRRRTGSCGPAGKSAPRPAAVAGHRGRHQCSGPAMLLSPRSFEPELHGIDAGAPQATLIDLRQRDQRALAPRLRRRSSPRIRRPSHSAPSGATSGELIFASLVSEAPWARAMVMLIWLGLPTATDSALPLNTRGVTTGLPASCSFTVS